MYKKVFGRKLSRGRKGRRALFRSLIKGLVSYGKITTTKAKAKAVQTNVEKLMTIVKNNRGFGRRLVLAKLGNDKKTTDKLFGEWSFLVNDRQSGFTRIISLPPRKGDMASLARLEFVEMIPKVNNKKTK